ncbi:MAG TPA: hypothetical protein VM534_09620 [Thermoanaerobaculia bacterium]|nr:hypothetical protein [Thermoanaerobaculia bacterium]
MPLDLKSELGNERIPQRNWLKMPVIGMESEFNVYLDEKEIIPEKHWSHPSDFIDVPLLERTGKSSQLPTGGAVYFDRGVIEVVTPVIELGPGSTARVVRSLWEQIAFVRDQLTRWESVEGHTVRLKAYSSHYNVSYEIPRSVQTRKRNVRKLALLLAYILPVPLILLAANRRSTGVGVRPRGNRIEITLDFTPDPALMIATMTAVAGVVREVMQWPSYELSVMDELPVPLIARVRPGKHTSRKGWLTKDFHYPRSPFTSDPDARIWRCTDGRLRSLRQIGKSTAWFFRKSMRRYSDPFSLRLLFAVLDGRAPSILELRDRPLAYDNVGVLCRWGMVLDDLLAELRDTIGSPRGDGSIDEYIASRIVERKRQFEREAAKTTRHEDQRPPEARVEKEEVEEPPPAPRIAASPRRRTKPSPVAAMVASEPRPAARKKTKSPANDLVRETLDRRRRVTVPADKQRRKKERRIRHQPIPFPDRRLSRSVYEEVFLMITSGRKLRIGRDLYSAIGMKGWYHAVFRRESDGKQRLLTIDQILAKKNDWV